MSTVLLTGVSKDLIGSMLAALEGVSVRIEQARPLGYDHDADVQASAQGSDVVLCVVPRLALRDSELEFLRCINKPTMLIVCDDSRDSECDESFGQILLNIRAQLVEAGKSDAIVVGVYIGRGLVEAKAPGIISTAEGVRQRVQVFINAVDLEAAAPGALQCSDQQELDAHHIYCMRLNEQKQKFALLGNVLDVELGIKVKGGAGGWSYELSNVASPRLEIEIPDLWGPLEGLLLSEYTTNDGKLMPSRLREDIAQRLQEALRSMHKIDVPCAISMVLKCPDEMTRLMILPSPVKVEIAS